MTGLCGFLVTDVIGSNTNRCLGDTFAVNLANDFEVNFFLGLIVMRDFASIKCRDSFRPKASGLPRLVGEVLVDWSLRAAWLLYLKLVI